MQRGSRRYFHLLNFIANRRKKKLESRRKRSTLDPSAKVILLIEMLLMLLPTSVSAFGYDDNDDGDEGKRQNRQNDGDDDNDDGDGGLGVNDIPSLSRK